MLFAAALGFYSGWRAGDLGRFAADAGQSSWGFFMSTLFGSVHDADGVAGL